MVFQLSKRQRPFFPLPVKCCTHPPSIEQMLGWGWRPGHRLAGEWTWGHGGMDNGCRTRTPRRQEPGRTDFKGQGD